MALEDDAEDHVAKSLIMVKNLPKPRRERLLKKIIECAATMLNKQIEWRD